MASWNLYDQLNKVTLGQLGAAGNRLLQGAANTLNRYGVGQPGGLTSLRPATGKQKLEQAWGSIPERLNSPQGGGFGYILGNQPNYSDAQGNMYDAVSGRLLYGVKPRTGSGSGSTGGGSLGGGSPAAERAYQAEKSRVAQLTAQDPELQRYEAARLKAVGPGATPEQVQSAEDIGMQMWAKANPTLAAKVKAGQSGYEAIQGTLAGNMARAGQGFGIAEQLVPTPQGFPTQVPGLPTGAGYSTGFGVTSNLAPGAQTPPPYSTIKPTSELSGSGAAPLGTAQTSVFGQPNVMDAAKFEELLKLVKK
jgi:hypothetical protein